MVGFSWGREERIMCDWEKGFGWEMDKECGDKLKWGNSEWFGFRRLRVVVEIVCESVLMDGDNRGISDRNCVYVVRKVMNKRVWRVKGFVRVWNGVFLIGDIYEVFEGIVIWVFLSGWVKVKFFIFG